MIRPHIKDQLDAFMKYSSDFNPSSIGEFTTTIGATIDECMEYYEEKEKELSSRENELFAKIDEARAEIFLIENEIDFLKSKISKEQK